MTAVYYAFFVVDSSTDDVIEDDTEDDDTSLMDWDGAVTCTEDGGGTDLEIDTGTFTVSG